MQKQKTLLIDLDSQASASLSFGVGRGTLNPSIADVLLEDLPIFDAIRTTSIRNLSIVTGSMGLANFDTTLAPISGREAILDKALAPIKDKFDCIILDCPPTMSLLPVNALVACDSYLVPVLPHYLALEGLVNLLDAIDRIKSGIGATGSLLGILLTMIDARTKVTAEISDIIRKQFPQDVFKTEIRTNVKLAEAPSFGKTIFQYDCMCTGAEAYQALAKEVMSRINKKESHDKSKNRKIRR